MTDNELELSKRVQGLDIRAEDVLFARKLGNSLRLLQQDPFLLARKQAVSILENAQTRFGTGESNFQVAYFIPSDPHHARMHDAFLTQLLEQGWAVHGTVQNTVSTHESVNVSEYGQLFKSETGEHVLHLTEQYDGEGNPYAYRYVGYNAAELMTSTGSDVPAQQSLGRVAASPVAVS